MNYNINKWQERDNAHIVVSDDDTDITVFCLVDEAVSEFITDGFMKHFDDDDGLIEYMTDMGFITDDDVLTASI